MMSPTLTDWSVLTRLRLKVPSAEPLSMPCALLDWIMAETPEFSSVMRRTVAVVALTSEIWPMTP